MCRSAILRGFHQTRPLRYSPTKFELMMKFCSSLPLIIVVLIYQMFAGAYGVGTVLCIGGANGLALLPSGSNCCALHAKAAVLDVCCATNVVAECENDPGANGTTSCLAVVNSNDCLGCTDHELMTQPSVQPNHVGHTIALPLSVIIATLSWPVFVAPASPWDARRSGERPPSLRILRMWSTVVLRC